MTLAYQPRPFTSWGGVIRTPQSMARPRFRDELRGLVLGRQSKSILAVGMGRSYGDSILNGAGNLIDMTGLDRLIAFDPDAGVLRAEAGVTLDAVLALIVPHGWFVATTPGTRFVTLAGAVANDVHGKNHHGAGTFGCSVRRIGLLRSDGTHHELDREANSALFCATIGGLGLTGVITYVEIDLARIPSAYLDVERSAFGSIAGFFELARDAAHTHEHTVAWFDCANRGAALGRGIFQKANWASGGDFDPHRRRLTASVAVEAPSWTLNGWSVRAFNAAYWRRQKAAAAHMRQHYAAFFYPLDTIGHWNRIYGAKGFYQYQCVIPGEAAEPAVQELVGQIARGGAGSFLAVLKTFGERASPGYLSFPCAGATLALDFPNRGARTLDLLSRLDKVVAEAGGRLYPAKDGRMPADIFQSGYAATLPAFASQIDPACGSDFWRRVSR